MNVADAAIDALRAFVEDGTPATMEAAKAALVQLDRDRAAYEILCQRRKRLTGGVGVVCTPETRAWLEFVPVGSTVTVTVSRTVWPGTAPWRSVLVIEPLPDHPYPEPGTPSVPHENPPVPVPAEPAHIPNTPVPTSPEAPVPRDPPAPVPTPKPVAKPNPNDIVSSEAAEIERQGRELVKRQQEEFEKSSKWPHG